MPGLALTLRPGDRVVVDVPLEDDNGRPYTEEIVVECERDQSNSGRLLVRVVAPRSYPIRRISRS